METSIRVLFQGRVQGVGFRYTTRQLAQDFSVHGFVRNLADGSVELVAAGEAEEVKAFLAAVSQRMEDYIHDRTITEILNQGIQGFNIRH